MKTIKLLSLLLLFSALVITLFSCKPQETLPPEDSSDEIVLFEAGQFNFSVTRPYKGKDTKLYSSLFNSLREISGCDDIDFGTDSETKDRKYDPEKPEILCGYTSYPESISGAEYLPFEGYRISFIGKKLSISARTSTSLDNAIDAFIDYVKENTKDGRLALPADFSLSGQAKNSKYNVITLNSPAVKTYESAEYSDCGDGFRQVTLKGMTKELFLDYKKSLSDSGFTLSAENDMAGNLFATYKKDSVIIHTYFIGHSKEMRIIAAKGAALPSSDEVSYTKVVEPSFTLMGLEKSGSEGGLGAFIQLEDGSFIIFDGGNHNDTEARDLRDTLLGLAPDKKSVTIRAWVFSHAHSDHYGVFLKFSENYKKLNVFNVESFIFNFCDTPEQKVHSESCNYSSTYSHIAKYWPDATVYKGLTGQVYRFAGCDMEILYCMSDFLPQIIGEEKGIYDINKDKVDGNIETMVVRCDIAGQKVMVTGDTTITNINEMCKRYGSYLKSKIMTVPHHGHNEDRYRARNSTKEFYDLVNPETVMWPAGKNAQASRLKWDGTAGSKYEINYYLLNKLNVKECIVSGSTTRTVILPYTPKK